jgi:hypothetical protein
MDSVSPPHLVPHLLGCTISEFTVRAGEHIFALNNGGHITSGGLWRLLLMGRIAVTEMDYEQSNWQSEAKPMNMQVEDKLFAHVIGKPILGARVTVPTGDLVIDLSEGAAIEFIKLHSFLESWEVLSPGMHLLVDAWGQVSEWARREV